uniref:UBX domain-containing protein n=1 Tax=Dunaliella tertiolecta TaxID=3047 RepID=A0A7S3VHV4_DUNTE|mmetsp:Transcript_1114/g.2613  ORF Transcript_1114/g.2613 Transcript_1114/m.2613 type:complete len:506 (-) Transcript_1114:199-1716(-)
MKEAVEQFCAITGTNSTEAENILEAVNGNVERAVDLYYAGPSARSTEVVDVTNDEHDADAAAAAALYEEDLRRLQDEPSIPTSRFGVVGGEPGPFAGGEDFVHPGPARPSHVQTPSDEEDEPATGPTNPDEDEDEDMLNTMAAQRRQSIAAATQAQRARDAMLSTTRQGMASMADSFAGAIPGGLPSMFPGLTAPFPDVFGRARGPGQLRGQNRQPSDIDIDDDADYEEARRAGTRRRIPVQTPGQGPSEEDGDAALARRLMEEEEAMGAPRPASTGPMHEGPQDEAEAHAANLHGAFDRHELEETRMLEASMLGIPYEPRLPTRGAPSSSAAATSAAAQPELGEHRSLRFEQDQAYEESLAADRAKEEAARAAALAAAAEAKRAQEEAEASVRAQVEEENRVRTELSRKAASLPSEPSSSEADTVNVMIRWPDGARQSRRFRKSEPLQAVFDYVDLQHQAVSVKPGTYNLVNSYPRKAFADGTPGSLTDAGITADTALFLEPKT